MGEIQPMYDNPPNQQFNFISYKQIPNTMGSINSKNTRAHM